MSTAVSLKHRDTANDTTSEDGEVTPDYDDSATTIYGYLQPSAPTQEQLAWGVSIQADAVLILPAGTDIRPDIEEGDGLGDLVTINSVAYQVIGVVTPPTRVQKLMVASLQRWA
jgi:hypothetical protein